jgi:hypothetical protein
MQERREHTRRRALKAGKAVYGDFRYTIDCIVRDLTPKGVRLKSDHAQEIPNDFFFYDLSDGSLQRSEVIWRTANEIGVQFVGDRINIHETNDPRYARFKYM